MKKAGLLTIGQAPRDDIAQDILPSLKQETELVQMGALDGLSVEEMEALPLLPDDDVLVTRLTDGSSVRVSSAAVEGLLEQKIHAMEEMGIRLVYLACTWNFPNLQSSALILSSQKTLFGVLGPALAGKTVGICVVLAGVLKRIFRSAHFKANIE